MPSRNPRDVVQSSAGIPGSPQSAVVVDVVWITTLPHDVLSRDREVGVSRSLDVPLLG